MSTEARRLGPLFWILAFASFGIPAFALRATGFHLTPPVMALLFGLGIVGGAFLLSWAAEVAQLDISASFAIAILALIAILPEYAIEAVLAWNAGESFDLVTREVTKEMSYVAANVTGANRLLIGLGWSAVILVFWFKRRRALDLRGYMSLEIAMLVVATLVSFLLFFMSQVHMIVAGVLIVMYLFYLWVSSTAEVEEPELVGVAATLGVMPNRQRRTAVALLFIYSAAVILVAAEPFVDALVETGGELGIEEFVLIQWLAPLASESPEIIIAVLFGLRANPVAGLSTLISAEVNQLTLLIGSMVVVFSISAGQPLNFPLDPRQSVEFLLTSTVSVLAIVMVYPRLVSWRSAVVLLGLFVVHLFFLDKEERLIFSYIYLGLAAALLVWNRRRIVETFKGEGLFRR